MDMLLVLLGLSLLIAMVVGLIKPSLVIRWGEKKTRPRVLMIYGGLLIVLLLTLPDRTLVKFIVRKFISYCLTERFRASNMQ